MKAESLGIGFSASYLNWGLSAWSLNRLIFLLALDEVYKTDSRDSHSIAHGLAKGELRGIYIPPLHQEADRNLIRQRKKSGWN
ncbi:hypothetical protein GCM10027036_03200 [Flavihumibacter cheonanensis]|uniref:hypothetical protein n=1 Tax=Flavihumibacter cheonanensis TaxID=1442385 RepID=UPI001EF88E80|nr:hypothetical protein [Flavihumibacter cheonanensis]MCG7752236.1 hypothetical protein [Flavihumibacter cheonanensis]